MAGVSSTTCSCSIIDTKHSASVLKSPVGAAALLLADSGASASSPPPRELSASPLSPSSCEETSSPRCLSPPCAAASLGELVTPIHNQCVRDAMQRITLQDEAEACFYVCDLRVLARQMAQWRALMPRVEPFYAVKCNSEPRVLQTLAQLDISGFDCASRAEMEAVLSMGVSPQRVIFANPCKQLAHITYARANGVQMMTFDNETELDKIQRLHPEAKLVLRVVTDDSRSVCRFSQKFGVPMTGVEALLRAAQARHLDVIGISFHVGSGCYDEFAFVDAVRRARAAFDIGAALGYTFTLLDIGGGFPGSDTGKISFKEVAAVMAPEIDRLFPADVRVIAEPGRYFVTAAFTLLTSIHSIRSFQQKKKTPTEVAAKHDDGHAPAAATNKPSTDMFAALSNLNDGESNLSATLATGREETEQAYMYYINDGIYGAFNCIFFDHAHVTPKVVTQNRKFVVSADGSKALEQLPTYETAVYGPTCDGIDCIARGAQLPQLFVGDWLMFEEFGAYTCVAATNFNGMAKARIDFIELDH